MEFEQVAKEQLDKLLYAAMAAAEDISFLEFNGLYVMIVMGIVAVIYIAIDYHKKKRL